MNDKKTTLQELKLIVKEFVDERDWNQFHTAKNLSMAIASEAAELMEFFKWIDSKESSEQVEKNRMHVEHELADIIITTLCFANQYNIDVAHVLAEKMKEIKAKYPVEKVKGKWAKYTDYKK